MLLFLVSRTMPLFHLLSGRVSKSPSNGRSMAGSESDGLYILGGAHKTVPFHYMFLN